MNLFMSKKVFTHMPQGVLIPSQLPIFTISGRVGNLVGGNQEKASMIRREIQFQSHHHHRRPFSFSFYLTTHHFPASVRSCSIAPPACFLLFPNQSQYVQPMCYFRRPAQSPASQGQEENTLMSLGGRLLNYSNCWQPEGCHFAKIAFFFKFL